MYSYINCITRTYNTIIINTIVTIHSHRHCTVITVRPAYVLL